jgi:hypothetical protein
MKRLVAVMILFVLTVVAFNVTPAEAQSLNGYDAYVLTNTLNLRETPSTTGKTIVMLTKGDRMNFEGRTSDSKWLKVKTENNQSGWVWRGFLFISNKVVVSNLSVVSAGAASAPAPGQPAPTAAPAGGAPPAPVVSGKVRGGFELGGQVQGLGDGTVNAMRRAGMKWVKRQFKEGDGAAVGFINEAHSKGFKALLSVVGNIPSVTNDGYQNTYAGYVGSLAAAGADAIEVWNEMNIDREWPMGQISPASYVNLLAKSYNAIKSKNANTIVIIGAPAPTGAEGAYGLSRVWNDDRYTAGLVAAGAGRYADCVGLHYNEGIVGPNQRSGDPRGDNYPTRYFYGMLTRGLKGFSLPGCYTEIGYLTSEGYGPLPGGFEWARNVTVSQQAAWLAQAAVNASASGRVRLMIIFNVDLTYYGSDPQAGFAIIRPGGGCPACDTLGAVVR